MNKKILFSNLVFTDDSVKNSFDIIKEDGINPEFLDSLNNVVAVCDKTCISKFIELHQASEFPLSLRAPNKGRLERQLYDCKYIEYKNKLRIYFTNNLNRYDEVFIDFIKDDCSFPEEVLPTIHMSKEYEKSVELINRFEAYIKNNNINEIGVDFETAGIPFNDENFSVVSVSFSTLKIAIALDFRYLEENQFDKIIKLLSDKLFFSDIKLFAYNCSFEMSCIYFLTKRFTEIHDSFVYSTCEYQKSSLKSFVTYSHLAHSDWDFEVNQYIDNANKIFETEDVEEKNQLAMKSNFDIDLLNRYNGFPFAVVPYELLNKYCALDSFYTLKLHHHYKDKYKKAYDVYWKNRLLGFELEQTGIVLDRKVKEQLYENYISIEIFNLINLNLIYAKMGVNFYEQKHPDKIKIEGISKEAEDLLFSLGDILLEKKTFIKYLTILEDGELLDGIKSVIDITDEDIEFCRTKANKILLSRKFCTSIWEKVLEVYPIDFLNPILFDYSSKKLFLKRFKDIEKYPRDVNLLEKKLTIDGKNKFYSHDEIKEMMPLDVNSNLNRDSLAKFFSLDDEFGVFNLFDRKDISSNAWDKLKSIDRQVRKAKDEILKQKIYLDIIRKNPSGMVSNTPFLTEFISDFREGLDDDFEKLLTLNPDIDSIFSKKTFYLFCHFYMGNRYANKCLTSYIDGRLMKGYKKSNLIEEDNRSIYTLKNKDEIIIRPGFFVNSLFTNRTSSAIHTFKKDMDYMSILKTDDEDVCLTYFDISSAEVRTVAYLSGDENMIDNFENGKDVYSEFAKYVFPDYDKEQIKEVRFKFKGLYLGLLYGLGVTKLASKLECTIDEARHYQNLLIKRHPKVIEFIEKKKRYAEMHGKIDTVFGDYIPVDRQKYFTAGINYVIQNSTAIILASGFYNSIKHAREQGYYISPKNFVHDSIWNCVKIKELSGILKSYEVGFRDYVKNEYGIDYTYDLLIYYPNLREHFTLSYNNPFEANKEITEMNVSGSEYALNPFLKKYSELLGDKISITDIEVKKNIDNIFRLKNKHLLYPDKQYHLPDTIDAKIRLT